MQKGFKEGLLKILKNYRDLQKSAPKVNKNNLNDFRSDLELLRDSFKSFKNASEREVKSRDSSEDFDEDQLETE